ncbi:MAG: hypothetical protein LBI18_00580, partial [Planctomycetaceae bacterium]|nr:hypothetical protein [Planctomycetaceae bacterium]
VALPLGNSPLFTDGNLYCQMVWNLIASRKQGLIGFRRCDVSAKHHPPLRQHHLPLAFPRVFLELRTVRFWTRMIRVWKRTILFLSWTIPKSFPPNTE